MIRLDVQTGPKWLDLAAGVRVHVLPLSTTVMAAAQKDVAARGGIDAEASGEEKALLMAKAVARQAIVGWEGVGDTTGRPAKVTPGGVDALLDLWPIFDAFQNKYLVPGMVLDAEKNGFAPSPTGTSAAANPTAKRARRPAKTARRG